MDLISKLNGTIPDSVIQQLTDVTLDKFGAKTPLRLAHFLGQLAHESGNFQNAVPEEDLRYSAQGMARTWPPKFAEIADGAYLKEQKVSHGQPVLDSTGNPVMTNKPNALALSLVGNKIGIANNAYAGIIGNGDVASGDGYNFRGRGFIQLTGRGNYAAFSKSIDVDCTTNPDLVATTYPMASALWFFSDRKLWATCDKGVGDDVVKAVTAKINPALLGLPERIQHFNQYYGLLSV